MNIDRLIDQCYETLPKDVKQKPWQILNHGYDVLDTDLKLNAYLAAYGEMHVMKCRMAFQNFPFDEFTGSGDISNLGAFRNKDIEIFDWGCGQGLGSLTFLDLLSERNLLSCVRRVNLIEPSPYALKRAEEWVKQSKDASTEIRLFERVIPDNNAPKWTDIDCRTPIAVHIFSNILDIRSVGLRWLAETVAKLAPNNYVLCVGPKYGGLSRISDFHNIFGFPKPFSSMGMFPFAYTSRTNHPYGIEIKCFKFNSSQALRSQYEEKSDQDFIDEYGAVSERLKQILPKELLNAYESLRIATEGYFELYLRPHFGSERPDFILLNFTRGVLLVNVCNNIKNFKKEFDRIEAIKRSFFDTYIDSMKASCIVNPSVFNTVKTALFFTDASHKEIEDACNIYNQELKEKYDKCGIQFEKKGSTSQHVALTDRTQYLIKLHPQTSQSIIRNIYCNGFNHAYYKEIKEMINGGWHHYAEGDPNLKLTSNQIDILNDEEKMQRIKGIAGSGKTLLLAHKAVKEHLRTGAKVLIITYNIALINYIKMRINQVCADFNRNSFEIINYHKFFTAKAQEFPRPRLINDNEQQQVDSSYLDAANDPTYFDSYLNNKRFRENQFETIIIDEAQDFTSAWVDMLRKYFLKENGRMIVFGDGEQNIYKRIHEHETKMPRLNGFPQKWKVMSNRISMRLLNPEIALLASKFSEEKAISDQSLSIQPSLYLFDYKIGYWLIPQETDATIIESNIRWILQEYNLNPKHTVVLAQGIDLLRAIDFNYRTNTNLKTKKTFEFQETFDEIKNRGLSRASMTIQLREIRRSAKVNFTTETEALKFATISSFKGWESKNVILLLQKEVENINHSDEDGFVIASNGSSDALIYTALTRARENLFILNIGDLKNHDFFKKHIKNENI